MTKEELKSAVIEAIDEKLSPFWVERELHYKHHEFIDKWMKWSDDMSKTIWHTIIKTIVLGALGLLVLGALLKIGWKHL